MEELKASHESELSGIRERLRKQKTSFDTSASDQLSRLESELDEQWKTKSERMVQQTDDKWKRKYRDLEVSTASMTECGINSVSYAIDSKMMYYLNMIDQPLH